MNGIKRFMGTLIGLLKVGGFTALIAYLVLSLAAQQLPALRDLGMEARCLLGIPFAQDTCVQDAIADLQDQRRDLQAQSQALADERDELSRIIAQQSYVFIEGGRAPGGATLVVGTLYRDAGAQRGLMRAFCWAITDRGGFDPRIGIAVMESDGRVTALPVGSDELDLVHLDAKDLPQARADCPFPGVS